MVAFELLNIISKKGGIILLIPLAKQSQGYKVFFKTQVRKVVVLPGIALTFGATRAIHIDEAIR